MSGQPSCDSSTSPAAPHKISDPLQHRGRLSFHAGAAAEKSVSRDYERRGYVVAHQRWRGKHRNSGEIDLVLRDGAALVFVEVKQSKNFERAAERVSPPQMRRIMNAAAEFLADEPGGQLTEIRFDVVLVNQFGELRVVENAFCEF